MKSFEIWNFDVGLQISPTTNSSLPSDQQKEAELFFFFWLDVEYINAKNTTELQRFFHELEKFHYNTVHAVEMVSCKLLL